MKTKVKQNFSTYWGEITVQFRIAPNSFLLIFSFMLARLIRVSYYFTLFTHCFLQRNKINAISPLKSDNYVSVACMKDLSNSLMPEVLWVMGLSPSWQKHNNHTLHVKPSGTMNEEREPSSPWQMPTLEAGRVISQAFNMLSSLGEVLFTR